MKPYLIGIAGPSCAGKSELSKRLSAVLDAAVLGLDCYYPDLSALSMEERARFNFDHPKALDRDLFFENVRDLAAGREIRRPVYDFAVHNRTGAVEVIAPKEFVIVEGLFVLYWEDVRSMFGTRVFVDLPDQACLQRRLLRDVAERGRTSESVRRQFSETVSPMARLYVRPSKEFADVVVRGDSDVEKSVATVLAHVKGNSKFRVSSSQG